jgi:hypothetical protein
MLAVQVVRAPPSSVVVYTLVLVVPILRLASEIGTEVGLTSSVLAIPVLAVPVLAIPVLAVSVIVVVDPLRSVVA